MNSITRLMKYMRFANVATGLLLLVLWTNGCNSSPLPNSNQSNGELPKNSMLKTKPPSNMETDPMFKEANRAITGAPKEMWSVVMKEIKRAQALSDPTDKDNYISVLKAYDNNTLNVKQPYELIRIPNKVLLKSRTIQKKDIQRGVWNLPLYNGEKGIAAWFASNEHTGIWHWGGSGFHTRNFTGFEKSKGYWNSIYQKFLIPDAESPFGFKYVGYVKQGRELFDGEYYVIKDPPLGEDSRSYTWKEVIDTLCEGAEERHRMWERMERNKQIRRGEEVEK